MGPRIELNQKPSLRTPSVTAGRGEEKEGGGGGGGRLPTSPKTPQKHTQYLKWRIKGGQQ